MVLDLKMPEGWSAALLPLLLPLFRPFGVTRDLAERRPWESVRAHLDECEVTESYFGYVYLAVGRKAPAPSARAST